LIPAEDPPESRKNPNGFTEKSDFRREVLNICGTGKFKAPFFPKNYQKRKRS
jgi:hypothetical protein